MAEVEKNSPFPSPYDSIPDASFTIQSRIRERPETVGPDVPGTHEIEHLVTIRRWKIDMGHQGQTGFFGDFPSDLQGSHAGIATGIASDSDFNADYALGKFPDGIDTFPGIKKADVLAFRKNVWGGFTETAYSGKGNIHESQNTKLTGVRDESLKTRVISCACTSCIDKGCGSTSGSQ